MLFSSDPVAYARTSIPAVLFPGDVLRPVPVVGAVA
jgi:hypothetical protein